KAYHGFIFPRTPGDVENCILDFSKPSPTLQNLILEEKLKDQFTVVVIRDIFKENGNRFIEREKREDLIKNLASVYHYYLNGVFGKSATPNQKRFSLKNLKPVDIEVSFHDDRRSLNEIV
ncbi:Structural maintenance of chromosomes flexible hinge, partial [Bonamia ostreae]